MTHSILKISFVDPDGVTGYRVEKDILKDIRELPEPFCCWSTVRKSRECCAEHSTQHDYRIDHNRLTFYRWVPVVLWNFTRLRQTLRGAHPSKFILGQCGYSNWFQWAEIAARKHRMWITESNHLYTASKFFSHWFILQKVGVFELQLKAEKHRGLEKLSFKFLAI